MYWSFFYKMKYAVKYNVVDQYEICKNIEIMFYDKIWRKARRFNNDSANSIQGSIVDLHSLEDDFFLSIFSRISLTICHLEVSSSVFVLLDFPTFPQHLLSMKEKVIIFPSTLYYVNCKILKADHEATN